MIGGIFAFLFFLIPPSVLMWIVINGLKTGVVRGRGGPMPRIDYPIGYWVIMTLYLVAFAMWAFFIGTIAIDFWHESLSR